MNMKKGAVVAAAVAGLFAVAAPISKAHADVKCAGVNGCKGKGQCGGEGHGCAGKNECKGKGWVKAADDKACASQGGKVVGDKAPAPAAPKK